MLLDWYPDSYYSCPDQPVIALGLKQVFTAFVMLGCGALASGVFLCLERTVFQFHYHQRRKRDQELSRGTLAQTKYLECESKNYSLCGNKRRIFQVNHEQ
ncbi:uncharacterized protein LOC119579798 [Penaeus monodon]|uniref:uncharacterized protein LOC119579798 n=1 Tax=Penaeus monodon TaxID=6687 RepID=UPI0018A7B3E7|nr:uncharacterized protein LOC119579798 [Penaeus monodon]